MVKGRVGRGRASVEILEGEKYEEKREIMKES